MRTWTVLLSVVVHGAMFGLVAWRGRVPAVHRGTEVSVVSKPKKAPEPKDEPKKVEPPPPPPPRVMPKVVAPSPAPAAPAPAPAPAPSGPRVATGLTLSNGPSTGGGPALAVAGPSGNGSNAAPGSAQPGQRLAPPPPVPKKEDDPCEAPDTKPRPLGSLQVEYPDKARADGVEGRIQVKIIVGEDGAVRDVQVVQSIEPSLDATVLAVLRTWKFAPATHCGRPAEGSIAWAQRFELGD